MIHIKYNFYNEYKNKDPNFEIIMNKRIIDIKNKYCLKNISLEENFVEIFSWSVIPYNILQNIYNIIKDKCDTVFDPCSGNGFHTYLFNNFTNLKTLTYDIQYEKNSWSNMIEKEGIIALKEIKNHNNICLFLSWIDYEELGIKLLKNFKGTIVISIGNYEEKSPNYLNYLYKHFKIIETYILSIHWDLTQKIEILELIM